VNILKPSLPQLATMPIGLLCMTAQAFLPQDLAIEHASSSQLRAAYVECDRRSSQSRVDLNFMIACERVGALLRERDFGGDFERLLQWWRQAREAPPAHGAPSLAAGDTAP
jgi:hypothetical protein